MCSLAQETPLPTTLVLEHHDSYTRNILSLFSEIAGSSRRAPREASKEGAEEWIVWQHEGWRERIVIVNVDTITWDQFVQDVLPHVACVVLGPGPGSPHKKSDFSWPARLITEYGDVLPIFGLCLGHQGLATTFGAQVGKAAAPRHGQVTQIRHLGDDLFTGISPVFDAVQYNSLTVKANNMSDELEAIAWATNTGKEEILGLRHRSKPLWGVQYHPESICSTNGATLLSNFFALARQHYARRPGPLDLHASLPQHIRALSTSHIPDASSLPNGTSNSPLWEERSALLADDSELDATSVFEGLVAGASDLGSVWLDSSRPTVSAQHSHCFTPQVTWTFSRPSDTLLIRSSASASTSRHIEPPQTLFSTLASAQDVLHRRTRIVDADMPTIPVGFVGYFGYEMKEVSMPLSMSSSKPCDKRERVDSEFAFASKVLTYDHERRRWIATGLVRLDDSEAVGSLTDGLGITDAEWHGWLKSTRAYFERPPSTKPAPAPAFELGTLVPDQRREEYMSAIERAREYITAGDAYELCLTTQFRRSLPQEVADDPYALYLALRARNPSPYSYFFHLPQSDTALLSSSPERFMRISKEGEAIMKPIKGTVRRSDDPLEDSRRRDALQADEKERAENLMIVDLSRNDLLGFCDVESVKVPQLMVAESYETVHQLVTSVVGQLLPDVNPFEAVGRAFPPGSMTGAPKLRSLKLLDELEGHRPRGVYSGVFGYVAVDGTTDFSVVIRTLVIKGRDLSLGAGGAITHLSNAAKEWEEVLVKTEAVLGAVRGQGT